MINALCEFKNIFLYGLCWNQGFKCLQKHISLWHHLRKQDDMTSQRGKRVCGCESQEISQIHYQNGLALYQFKYDKTESKSNSGCTLGS